MRSSAGFISMLLSVSALAACGSKIAQEVNASHPVDPVNPISPEPTPGVLHIPAGPGNGAPSEIYPAFKPDVGLLTFKGGAVLKSPMIVTITFPGDTSADRLEEFGDKIGATKYWTEITSEYGVGPASSGPANHIRLTDAAPAEMSESDIDDFIAKHADDLATSKWPAPSADSLYVLYLPAGTSLTLGGSDACSSGVGGYHTSTYAGGRPVAYAVLPRCGKFDYVTNAASHEMGEAAVDPYPNSKRAWDGFDAAHAAWEMWQNFQTENGDMCEFFRDSVYRETGDFAFVVQRQWSNKSASAGHAPCVPASAAPYFSTTPIGATDPIDLDLSPRGSRHTKTVGFHIGVGETRTFPVGFYSDAPRGTWTFQAVESRRASGAPRTPTLDVKTDITSGKNGNIAYVTVTVNSAWKANAEVVMLVSSDGKSEHYAAVLIGN